MPPFKAQQNFRPPVRGVLPVVQRVAKSLAALVTPAEVMENQPMLDLRMYVRFRWRLRPRQVTGDTKYGTLQNIKAIEDAGMRAYIPLFNRENEHGAYYGSSRFTYDAVRDAYICPNGQLLHLTRMEYKAEKAEYQADAAACNGCPRDLQSVPLEAPLES